MDETAYIVAGGSVASSFKCEVCCKVFSRKKNMKAHMRSHYIPKTYYCEVCAQLFYDQASLQHHMITHTGKKVHECAACHKLYSRKTTLEVHMRLHTRETLFQCTVCGKANGTRYDLLIHMRTHTGEKPFICPVCEPTASFVTQSSLKRHMRLHSGERPYTCGMCQKTFTRKDQYRKHVQTHLEYHCQVCDKKFPNFWKFSEHSPCEAGPADPTETFPEGESQHEQEEEVIEERINEDNAIGDEDQEIIDEAEDALSDGVEWGGEGHGGETVLQILVEDDSLLVANEP